MGKVDLSIVIPAYNEEKRVLGTLSRIIDYFKNRSEVYEIIVVNDGSIDKTKELIENFSKNNNIKLISYEPNRGKGFAVRTGVLNSKGELILFTDADLATPIEEYEKLLSYIRNGYDIAIGSRALKESKIVIHQPFYREIAGKAFNKVVQLLTVKGINDTQCGFKLFKGDVGREIFSRCKLNGFSFDIEFLFYAKKLNYKIIEVPVIWIHQERSKVKLLRDGFRMLLDLILIRLNSRI